MSNKTIILQSSMPRAGSTLFQNIVGQNPNFYVTPTSGVATLLKFNLESFSRIREFKESDYEAHKKAFYNFCKKGIEGYYNTFTSKPFILDKSKVWISEYNLLKNIFPNLKIVVLIRDIREIIFSLEKYYQKDPIRKYDWIFPLNIKQEEVTTLEQRYYKYISNPPIYPYIEWLFNLTKLKNLSNFCFIKYEDLCFYPEQTLYKFYNFLELPYYKHNFNYIEQITYENDSFQSFGNHTISPKLKMVNNNSQKNIPEEILEDIYTRYEWYFKFFKYNK